MYSKFNLALLSFVLMFTVLESRHHSVLRVAKDAKLVGHEKSAKASHSISLMGRAANIDLNKSNDKDPPVKSDMWEYIEDIHGVHFWFSKFEGGYEDVTIECKRLGDKYRDEVKEDADLIFSLFYPEGGADHDTIVKLINKVNQDYVWLGLKLDPPPKNQTGSKNQTLSKNQKERALTKNAKNKNALERSKRTIMEEPELDFYSSTDRNLKREIRSAAASQITVQETLFPWLSEWGTEVKECANFKGCKPVKCNVTTPECSVEMVDCVLNGSSTCSVISTGKCTAICESCKIDNGPECWMADNKCTVEKDRQCKMSEPKCRVQASPCTITRPPCVTKQPPCKIKTTVDETPSECSLPTTCSTAQSPPKCTKIKRDCTAEETASGKQICETLDCVPSPICIIPEYCRKVNMTSYTDCEPPTTFCPPEIVKCLPPTVTCDEPELVCTDPEINCPPPQAHCTTPRVSCTSPKVSCPTLAIKCTNPTAICPPPKVVCKEPEVQCSEPTPCFVSSDNSNQGKCGGGGTTGKPDVDECKVPGVCECAVIRLANTYTTKLQKCTAKHKAFCVAIGSIY